MKTWKIDQWEINAQQKKGDSNYELRVSIFKNKTLVRGGILKNGSSDLEILEWAISAIKNADRRTTIDEYFFGQ